MTVPGTFRSIENMIDKIMHGLRNVFPETGD